MRVPISWLKSYVDINLPVEELAQRLTMAGLEVGGIDMIGDWWDPATIVVGQVVNVLPHPDAERLVLVDVDFGDAAPERVVTGAPNLFQYRDRDTLPTLKVAFAMAGAMLVDAYSDAVPRPVKKLKPSKIRGVKSSGMVCSERELGLSEEHEGIIILAEDAPVGTPLRDYLGEAVLDIELTPDMARALSMAGVAREVAALTGAALHLPADEWQPQGDDRAADYVAVEIEDPDLCGRYTGVMVLGAKVGPSPKWMQERLQRAGMRPISNIVDITNYVMLELGQPLHAFDYDILKRRAQSVGHATPTIIVRRAQEGERFVTLDDVTRTLDDSMLMICDTAGSIAIAGVMGGQESEVGDATVNILLESATFEGINNRRTASKLRLPSEASYRFARGVPATLNPIAARRAAELMRLYAGARIVPGIVDTYPVPQPQRVVYTTISDMRRILGIPVTKEDVVGSLERLEFVVTEVSEPDPAHGADATFALHRTPGETLFQCFAPWYRLDINIPADLTEEVARMIGYEQVGLTLLDTELPTQRRNELLEAETHIRDILTAAGLQETINYPLTSPENHDKLQPGRPPSSEDDYIVITNPIAPERRAMRRSMLVSALENLARNLRYTDRLTTFELGRIYLPEHGNGELPLEERRLSVLLCGPRAVPSFYNQGESEAMDYFDLKGIVEALFAHLGFAPSALRFEAAPAEWPFGPRCAKVCLNDTSLGFMGEIHPAVRNAFGLPDVRVVAAELAVAPAVRSHWRLEPMQPISSYPPVVEDLAFEVAEEVTAHRVEELINRAGGDLLVDVALFDVYRGEPLAAGNKSLAYALTYQSLERSLSDKEVTRLREKIISTVEKETGGKLRR